MATAAVEPTAAAAAAAEKLPVRAATGLYRPPENLVHREMPKSSVCIFRLSVETIGTVILLLLLMTKYCVAK